VWLQLDLDVLQKHECGPTYQRLCMLRPTIPGPANTCSYLKSASAYLCYNCVLKRLTSLHCSALHCLNSELMFLLSCISVPSVRPQTMCFPRYSFKRCIEPSFDSRATLSDPTDSHSLKVQSLIFVTPTVVLYALLPILKLSTSC
jgi:hypothetical protein